MTARGPISPNHRAIRKYYESVAALRDQHVFNEMNVRSAFESLLADTARLRGWTLIAELSGKSGGSLVRPDGTVRDANSLPRGYWEAKDTKDDLETEINKKIARGYPLSNIIFEDTSTGVLYQNKQTINGPYTLGNPQELAALLNQFFSYTEPDIEGFDEAIGEFKERVPELARGLTEKIREAHEDNPPFQEALPAALPAAVQSESLMPALKPDSSFFRKIAIGAIGTRAVCADLNQRQHTTVELERGSTDTKLWKDVKRKRVRIPDLVCTKCGLRIESRAKSKPELSMSHSPTETERSWDFGMVDADLVAYPVCVAVDERYWSSGKLNEGASYWHERNWVKWQAKQHINYFSVAAFRVVPFVNLARKGVTEGSELTICWPATFATYDGVAAEVEGARVSILRNTDHRTFARTIKAGQQIAVQRGQTVSLHEVIASTVLPLQAAALQCPGGLARDQIARLLASRERTQRYTGVKLARLRGDASYADPVTALVQDAEEDLYVKLESVSYLSAACGQALAGNVEQYLTSPDPQIQLESVITLGETATAEAGQMLSAILENRDAPYFLRSAAAWGLARIGGEQSIRRLIRAFADVDFDIRQEALDSVVALSREAVPFLLASLRDAGDDAVSAGSAEALRQFGDDPAFPVGEFAELLNRAASPWSVWLAGVLPRDRVAAAVAPLQDSHPELHYAITVLWSFVESWIARRWELRPRATFPEDH